MSEIIEKAKKYVEQSKIGFLLTVDENNIPFVRPIGAFAQEGLDIYFLTRRETEKVKHIEINPIATVYFRNENQDFEKFRSESISGEIFELTKENEIKEAIEKISVRYPKVKELVDSGEFHKYLIFVVKAKLLKSADYVLEPKETVINL
jgi:Uncharacterized stress protein (general stress protein 26)